METRRLGRLGHMSSVLIYGGAALAEVDQDVADESISLALEAGMNHFDTSDDYGDSEVRLGKWMPQIRPDIFLATKATERTKEGAAKTIRRSLERLQTDRLDLLQLHAIVDMDELDKVTQPGGALDAVIEAREEGLVRGIGITGHGMAAPATHLEALHRFPFDTVITPFNYRLARESGYASDFEALAGAISSQDAALILIKHVARNLWLDAEKPRFATWYEPLTHQDHIDAAVAFALSRPEATGLCTAGDVRLLPSIIEAERKRLQASPEDIERVLSQVEGYEPPFVATPGRSIPGGI